MAGELGHRATPPLLKQLNQRTVLEAVRADAPISRAEISRRAGISKPTVSLALQSLLEAGLVRESEHRPDGPSFGAVFFEPVPDAALVLGLDLGARFAARSGLRPRRARSACARTSSSPGPSSEAAIAAIEAVTSSLIEATDAGRERIGRVVVGVPGVVDAEGRLNLTHFRELEGIDLGRDLGRRLGLDVTLVNDINLAALGEEWQGVARGVDDFAFLSVGTGLGHGARARRRAALRPPRRRRRARPRAARRSATTSTPPRAPSARYAAELAAAPGRDGADAALRAARGLHRRPPRRRARARRGRGGRAADRAAHRPDRSGRGRRSRRARRRDRRERRPAPGADPRHARLLAALSAAARGLEPRRGRGAVRAPSRSGCEPPSTRCS